jgi:signal peptidase I
MKLYGTSMEPSILDESILFVWQQDFEISREDILVIEFPERWQDDFKLGFKRVIGMPGDSFYFVDDKVYINGKEYWYWWAAKGEIMKGIENDRIKEDYYFILGDNFNSLDSRYIGLIHRSKVYGKVMFVLIEGKEPKSSLENDH